MLHSTVTPHDKRVAFRAGLASGTIQRLPGAFTPLSVRMIQEKGFEGVYISGAVLSNELGLPDIGLVTGSEMAERARVLADALGDVPLIADADTGYGGLLNMHHTVRGYEAAGVSAIQIEDQEFPKKCGHTPFKRIVPVGDMVEKIKVAVDARRDPNFLVIARTDARQSEGVEGVLRRLDAYAKAGADVLFPEALTTEDEMRAACTAFDKPVMANMADGGLTPILPADTLRDIGYAFAIYPSTTSLVAAAAMERTLTALKETGRYDRPGDPAVFDFKTFCSMIGFEDVWAFEKQWARNETV